VIGDGTAIGPDCILHAHVSIRERCTIGARVIVQNGAVIGSDGYGFAQRADGSHEKIPQTAPVVIEDDVEIGANTTIDRPAVGETRIKAGTKIDNLVQIAHGVVLGKNVLLAAQVGLDDIPAPVERMCVRLEEFELRTATQQQLLDRRGTALTGGDGAGAIGGVDDERVQAGVRHVQATVGEDALLQVLEVEPDSRVLERHAVLVPRQHAVNPADDSPASVGRMFVIR
jgi:hypothetical protein